MATFEADLTTLLGALCSSRCYPLINTSLAVVSPYITFQVIRAVPLFVTGSSSNGRQEGRVQIDVWGLTFGSAKTLAASVRTAMDGWTIPNSIIDSQDLYEEVSKEYRVLLEYSVWPL
jgi:hypothetical protein